VPFALPVPPNASDPDPREIYERLTHRKWDDLPSELQRSFRFLPPEADRSDIEFVLDPPPQAGRLTWTEFLAETIREWEDWNGATTNSYGGTLRTTPCILRAAANTVTGRSEPGLTPAAMGDRSSWWCGWGAARNAPMCSRAPVRMLTRAI
jgi:hypothetical protein